MPNQYLICYSDDSYDSYSASDFKMAFILAQAALYNSGRDLAIKSISGIDEKGNQNTFYSFRIMATRIKL